MAQLRKTRAQIDPELLDQVRSVIQENARNDYEARRPDTEPVDRAKMLAIAVRFLELQPHNEGLKKEIKSFLAG